MSVFIDNIVTLDNCVVFNMYFNSLPILFERYYIKGNLLMSNKKTQNISIMYADTTGFPVLYPYNGVNYTNLPSGALAFAFMTLYSRSGDILHEDMPLLYLFPNSKKNYRLGGDVDYDKSYMYWTNPPATVNNVIPFKIDF